LLGIFQFYQLQIVGNRRKQELNEYMQYRLPLS
jgi:hypothetical protein